MKSKSIFASKVEAIIAEVKLDLPQWELVMHSALSPNYQIRIEAVGHSKTKEASTKKTWTQEEFMNESVDALAQQIIHGEWSVRDSAIEKVSGLHKLDSHNERLNAVAREVSKWPEWKRKGL